MPSKSLSDMDNESNAALEISIEAENQTENVETLPPQNRKQFILRVFLIAAFMIFVCLSICFILNLSIEYQDQLNDFIFVEAQHVCFYVAILFYFLQQKSPWNWILLPNLTAFSALSVASHLSFYDIPLIIAAFISTILVSIVSILYGIYTKTDYTNFWELVIRFYIVSIASYIILAVAGLFKFNIPEFYRNYCILNSLLRIFMLVFDVQLIMGKMRFKFREDEIFPAILTIFIDVLYLLLFMLASMGGFGSGNGLNMLFNIFLFPLPDDLSIFRMLFNIFLFPLPDDLSIFGFTF